MKFVIPRCLKEEHEELHLELARAMGEPGEVGAAAKEVRELLRAHACNEEHYALPPLGLLPALARCEITPEMVDAIALTDDLRKNLPVMLADHKRIVAALKDLIAAANNSGKLEYAVTAEKIIHHIEIEEQIAYPAAILVGEFLKLKLDSSERPRRNEQQVIFPDII